MKKILVTVISVLLLVSLLAGCGSAAAPASAPAASGEPVKIGIPDDATNGGRAIKLLESVGLITVDPAAGWVPELKDVTGYLYNVEIVPTQANTLPATLDDFGAATINGTYAIPTGLLPSRDGLAVESQADATGDEGNPFVNVVVARTEDKDNPLYAGYKSEKDGKTVVTVGVCGASNDHWNAAQYVLDQNNANIYIELVVFDAYNLPNEALNSGEVDLNSFQHKAFLANEVNSQGYEIETIFDTLMAPLTLYSKQFDSVDALKAAAGEAA